MDDSGILTLLPSLHPINISSLLQHGTVSTFCFKYIKVHTATRWTIRHSLKLHWFADLMNVTEEVTIHRPNVSTLKSSEFTLCCEIESLSLNKLMIAFWQTRHSLEQKGIKRINDSPSGLIWGCYAAEINWGANQCLAPSVKRGKICVC